MLAQAIEAGPPFGSRRTPTCLRGGACRTSVFVFDLPRNQGHASESVTPGRRAVFQTMILTWHSATDRSQPAARGLLCMSFRHVLSACPFGMSFRMSFRHVLSACPFGFRPRAGGLLCMSFRALSFRPSFRPLFGPGAHGGIVRAAAARCAETSSGQVAVHAPSAPGLTAGSSARPRRDARDQTQVRQAARPPIGVGQCRDRNSRRHERARSSELVVGYVAQLGESFERKSNALEVRISRIDELQPSKSVHLITRWCREAPAPERAQNHVQQRVARPSDARPPMSFGRAGRQFSADIKSALPSIRAIDR